MTYEELLTFALVVLCPILVQCLLHTVRASLVEPHILGGEDAVISDFPYQVSLRQRGVLNGNGHIGAASILNERYLLTAAHCLPKPFIPNLYYVVAGSTKLDSGKPFEIDEISVHNKYRRSNPYQFDVAVIKLRDPLVFSETIKAISMVPVCGEPPVGTKVVVAGWGRTNLENKRPGLDSSDLKKIELQISDRDSCSACLGVVKITPRVICAGSDSKQKTDASLGDSGGPLVDMRTRRQVGIVSFGTEKATKLCPGVYTNLADTDVRNFIDEVLEK